MSAQQAVAVDVRDMLCAQALAAVARAIESLHEGQRLDILYNAEDVKRDLLVWAQDRGHAVRAVEASRLRLERRRAAPR